MRDVNEINKKIAELEKQRDALSEAEKTGGFKVGDKVVIEGTIDRFETEWNIPVIVQFPNSVKRAFKTWELRHAEAEQEPIGYVNIYESGNKGYLCDTAECAKWVALSGKVKEVAVPLYRTPQPAPDASKRIAELEGRIEKIKAEAKRWKEAYQDSAGSANSTNTANMVCDLVEARKEIEDLQDMLCKKKFDELVPTGDDVATDHIVEPNKMVVAPKGVKEKLHDAIADFQGSVQMVEREPKSSGWTERMSGDMKAIRNLIDQIVELPEPNGLTVAPNGVKEDIKKANRECEHTRAEAALIAHNYKSTTQEQVKAQELWVNASRKLDAAIDQIIELPEPSEWAVNITRLGVPPTQGCGLEFQGHELDIAAALIKAAQEADNA